MTADGRAGRPVEAVDRSLSILEAVQELDGATVTELSDQLGMAKSTVLNHVATLEYGGYLVREENQYHIGLKFLHFGEYAQRRTAGHRYRRRLVFELANETGEEADFTVEENGRLITLNHALPGANESGLQVGSYFHMHNTAGGKAILARMSDERVDAIVDRWGLPASTRHTITTRDQLMADLERTRDRGYALNDEELMEGYRSISVSVPDPEGGVLGALSVGGATYRVCDPDDIDSFLAPLQSAVESLEADIEKQPQVRSNWWGQYFPGSR